jgi:hypothetical protein
MSDDDLSTLFKKTHDTIKASYVDMANEFHGLHKNTKVPHKK